MAVGYLPKREAKAEKEPVAPAERRKHYELLRAEAERELQQWVPHFHDISKLIHPRGYRSLDASKPDGRRSLYNDIVDNTATWTAGVLAAGMLTGVTSPARPWFRLTLPDTELSKRRDVSRWLEQVTQILLGIFSKSNTYNALYQYYRELGVFGTACGILQPDVRTVIRHVLYPAGSYALATDFVGQVNTMTNRRKITAKQAVEWFGEEKVSDATRTAYRGGNKLSEVEIVHVVTPQRFKSDKKLSARAKPYASCWYETGDESKGFLREAGFDFFPVMTPRWGEIGNEVYGESPGMVALGDIKQLQHGQIRKAQAIDYMVDPPLQVPATFAADTSSRLPGGLMFVGATGAENIIRPAYEVRLQPAALLEDIADVRQRIQRAFYTDVFLMLANSERAQITATEVAERHEEKLLMLGPVLERVYDELLRPLIDQTFYHALRAGLLPEPPEDLQGQDLTVDFVSILAQAQKAVASRSLDRMLQSTAVLAQFDPGVVDKINFDKAVDLYGEMYAVSPDLLRDGEELAALREQKAQAQAAQQRMAMIPAMAETAKTLGETDMDTAREGLAAMTGTPSGAPTP